MYGALSLTLLLVEHTTLKIPEWILVFWHGEKRSVAVLQASWRPLSVVA